MDVEIRIMVKDDLTGGARLFKTVTLRKLRAESYSVFDVEMAIRQGVSKMGALE